MKKIIYCALAILAAAVFCSSGSPAANAAAAKKQGGMATIVNTATITGSQRAVFDLVTTARLWTRWHPASQAVGGVVERPYGAGDLVHERGRVGDVDFNVTWRVVEHVGPSRVVLESQSTPARITYSFESGKGTTTFTRKLEYQKENFPSVNELDKIMREQSARALVQLKALIEEILKQEAKPLT